MSVVIAYAADSVLTSAVNGRLIDATSYLDSEAGSTANTTSPVYSSGFALAATPVDCFYVKVASRVASPTGTTTFVLRNTTDNSDLASVTINASDIPANAAQGWIGIKFAQVTPNAAKTYAIGFSGSVSAQVTIYRNATAGNWCRLVRLTTAQAPAAGDMVAVAGEITGAGATTTRTVTQDSDGTTTYGSLIVGFNGTVTWDTTAGVTRNLKLSGFTRSDAVVDGVVVFTSGVINIGSVGTPHPSTSTAIIDLLCGSNVAYGVEVRGGTLNTYGATTTLQCFLAQDYSAGSTVLNLTVNGGGNLVNVKAGAVVAFAPGSTNAAGVSACESFTLGVDPTGPLQITLPSGLVNDRLNVATYPVEALILTTNVKIRGASNTLQTYVNVQANSTWTARYTEHKWLGSATNLKRGGNVAVGTATNVQFCVFREFGMDLATKTQTIATCDAFLCAGLATFSNNVGYLISTSLFDQGGVAGVSVYDSNWGMVNSSSSALMNAGDNGSTYTNNRVAAANGNFSINENGGVLGVFTGNVSHHCTAVGFAFGNVAGGAVSGLLAYKNTTSDLQLASIKDTLTIDSSTFAWSPGTNVSFSTQCFAPVILTNCNLKRGLSGTLTPIAVTNGTAAYATFRNCVVEAVTQVSFSSVAFGQLLFDNCTCPNAVTDVANQSTNMLTGSYVSFDHYNQGAGQKFYRPECTRTRDTVIFDAGAASTRIAPNSASVKAPTHTIFVPVSSGQTPTVSVRVRKSKSTDAGGADYNGNQPRLMLRTRYAMGVTSDTVLATAAAALGTWETLSPTLPAAPRDGVYELYVDGDGTAGWWNVDTETVTGAATDAAGTAKYWTANADPLPFSPGTLPALNLTGTIAGTATTSGTITVTRKCSGAIAGVSACSGSPAVTRRLTGAIAGQSALVGALNVTRHCSGAITAGGTLSGTATVTRRLTGSINATTAIAGHIRAIPIKKGLSFGEVEVEGVRFGEVAVEGVRFGDLVRTSSE